MFKIVNCLQIRYIELPLIEFFCNVLNVALSSVKTYSIAVATGDHWAAETDSNVFVTLFGSNGDSGKRLLHKTKSGNKKFQRGMVGSINEFTKTN